MVERRADFCARWATPTFTISVVNETFSASNHRDVPSLDTATSEALRSALEIGAEEVIGGKPFFAAEVTVETANQTLSRFVVSIGASPLKIVD